MNNKIGIAIKTVTFIIFCGLITSCCVFKTKPGYQPTGSFACAEFGNGDTGDSQALPGFQIGTFFILTPEACSILSESSKASDATVEVGMLVSGKGNENEMEEPGGDGFEPYRFSKRTRTTYLDIPVIAKVPVYKGLSVHGGPQASFLLGAKTTTEVNGNKDTTKGTDGFNSFDFGLSVGLDYELDNGLSFGLGYDHGLSNVYKSDYGSNKSKNRFLKATVGLNLTKFKGKQK